MPCPECNSGRVVSGGAGAYKICCECPTQWTVHNGKYGEEITIIRDKHGNDPRMYRCECGHPQHQHYMDDKEHPEGWFKPHECEWFNCDCTEFKMDDNRFEIIGEKIVRKEI